MTADVYKLDVIKTRINNGMRWVGNYKLSTAYSQYVTYYQIVPTQVTDINSDKTFESHSANIIYVYNSTDGTYIVETKYNSANKDSYYTLVATSGLSSTDSAYLSATHTDADKDAKIVAGSYYQVYGATYQFGDLVEQSTSQQVSYQVVGYVGTSSSIAKGVTTESATVITSDGAYYLVEKVTTVLDANSFRDTYSSTSDYYANTSYVKFVSTGSAVTPTDSNYSQYFEKIGNNYVRLSKSTSYASAVYYTVKASFQMKDNLVTSSTSTSEVIISATNFTDYGATYYLTSKTYYTLNADSKTYSIATYVSGGTYYTLTQVNELYTKTGSNYNVATTITNGDYYYQEKYKYVSSPDFTSGTTYYYLADNKYNSTTSEVSGASIYFVPVYNDSAVTIDGTNNSLVKITGTLVESKVTVTAWVYRVTISYYNATGLYARTKYEIVQEQNPAQVLSPLALEGLLGTD